MVPFKIEGIGDSIDQFKNFHSEIQNAFQWMISKLFITKLLKLIKIIGWEKTFSCQMSCQGLEDGPIEEQQNRKKNSKESRSEKRMPMQMGHMDRWSQG